MTTPSELLALAADADAYNQHSYAQHLRNRAANDGVCSGCNFCCDECLHDRHSCMICEDAVSHNHTHDEDESPFGALVVVRLSSNGAPQKWALAVDRERTKWGLIADGQWSLMTYNVNTGNGDPIDLTASEFLSAARDRGRWRFHAGMKLDITPDELEHAFRALGLLGDDSAPTAS